MMTRNYRIAVCLSLLTLAACSTERKPGELFGTETRDGLLVIDALLIVDRPLPEVLLSETIAPGQPVNDRTSGVSGAEVAIGVDGVFQIMVVVASFDEDAGLGCRHCRFPPVGIVTRRAGI